jgi:hypothetical protein
MAGCDRTMKLCRALQKGEEQKLAALRKGL